MFQDHTSSTPLVGAGDLHLAVIVDPELAPGLMANTVAVIAAGLGARVPGVGGVTLTDAAGVTYSNSADRPIAVLQAGPDQMRSVMQKAAAEAAIVPVIFPAFARALHSFSDYAALVPDTDLANAKIDGIGLAGPKKAVRSITGALKLLR